jgi:hypothetical protein
MAYAHFFVTSRIPEYPRFIDLIKFEVLCARNPYPRSRAAFVANILGCSGRPCLREGSLLLNPHVGRLVLGTCFTTQTGKEDSVHCLHIQTRV